MAMRPLSTDEFDPFVEGLNYPLFVVTAAAGTDRAGCLVGFATQVSIDPPRFLVGLSNRNRTLRVAAAAEFLAVHVLQTENHDSAALFGGETGDEVDKFAAVGWHPGPGGVPLLDDVPRRMVGRVLERLPLGDHVGYLLAPVEADVGDGWESEVLTLRDVDDVEPGHPA